MKNAKKNLKAAFIVISDSILDFFLFFRKLPELTIVTRNCTKNSQFDCRRTILVFKDVPHFPKLPIFSAQGDVRLKLKLFYGQMI